MEKNMENEMETREYVGQGNAHIIPSPKHELSYSQWQYGRNIYIGLVVG